MNITVMGSGNSGLAVAYHWASKAHRVNLYAVPGHDDNISAVAAAGGIRAHGDIEEFAPGYSGTDVTRAMEDTETVFVVALHLPRLTSPGLRHPTFGRGWWWQSVLARAWAVWCSGGSGPRRPRRVIIGETNTLPYASAPTARERFIFHSFSTSFYAAAAPRTGNARMLEVIRMIYPYTAEAATVFQTTLQNGNPVIHPAVTLLNTSLIERTGGDFNFYEDGVTRCRSVDGEVLTGNDWRSQTPSASKSSPSPNLEWLRAT